MEEWITNWEILKENKIIKCLDMILIHMKEEEIEELDQVFKCHLEDSQEFWNNNNNNNSKIKNKMIKINKIKREF